MSTKLYHSVFNKETYDYVLKNGITKDDTGWVYLSEKPFDYAYAVFEITVPDDNLLYDWKQFWLDDEGNEIDMDHEYDSNNPYYMYADDIPLKYIKEISKNKLERTNKIMVKKLHIKENLVNLMDSKVYDNIALLGYTCSLAANDLHHIHLCAVGDKFQEIHTDAENYMDKLREVGDFCFELAKEGGLQLYNETNALEVLKDSGNDWKVLEDNNYDFDKAYENMSDIFTSISEFIMTIQKLEGITSDVSSKLDEYLRDFTKIVNYFIEKKLNSSENDILVSDTVDTTYATAESFRRNRKRPFKEANKGYSAKVYQILDDTYVSETDGKVDTDFISDNVDLYIFNDRDSYFNGIKNTRRKATSVAYDGLLNLFQVNIDDAEGKVRITSEMAKQWLKKHGIDYITLLKPVVDHIEQYREENKNESFKKNRRKSFKESQSSKKYTGKTWKELIDDIESNSNWIVDSVDRNSFGGSRGQRSNTILLYNRNKDGVFVGEVTKYSDGSYELMDYNIVETNDWNE